MAGAGGPPATGALPGMAGAIEGGGSGPGIGASTVPTNPPTLAPPVRA